MDFILYALVASLIGAGMYFYSEKHDEPKTEVESPLAPADAPSK